MKKINLAFLGFGYMASNFHAKYIAENRSADVSIEGVYGILPVDMDKTREKIKKLGLTVEPEAITETIPNDPESISGVYKIIDKKKKIDAVIISTPHSKHFEQIKRCLKNGIHVLVDKPLAHTRQEARELVEIADKNDCALVVASQRRYEPTYSHVAKIILNREIGKIKTASVLFSQSRSWTATGWRLDPNLSGGGVAGDIGWHTLDFLAYLFGDRVDRVDASLWYDENAAIEHCAAASIGWKDGPMVQVNINQLAPENAVYERFYFSGTEGVVFVDRFKPQRDSLQPTVFVQKGNGHRVEQPDFSNAEGQRWAPTKAFLDYLSARINESANTSALGENIVSWGKQSITTVSIIERIYQSAASGKPV